MARASCCRPSASTMMRARNPLPTPKVIELSAHEKVPFAVTPLMPYIKYSESSAQPPSREASGSLR